MNPLLIAGIVGVGERLVSSVLTPAKVETSERSFESHLKTQNTSTNGALSAFLQQRGVQNFEGLQALGQQLQIELQHHPELAQKIAALPAGTPLSLKVVEGSLITLETPEGTVATLPKDSELGQLALRLHDIKSIENERAQLPGATLPQLVNHAERQPLLNASWVLREGV